jgi:hypothetical protein
MYGEGEESLRGGNTGGNRRKGKTEKKETDTLGATGDKR